MVKTIIIFMYADIKEYPPSMNAAEILVEKGWNVTVLNMYERDSDIDLNPKIRIKYIGSLKPGIRNLVNFIHSIFVLLFQTLKYKPQWILSYDGMSVFPAFLVSRITKAKWVYHQHDYWEKAQGWLRFPHWCEKKLTRFADIISFPQVDRAKLFKKKNELKNEIEIVLNGPRRNWTSKSSPDKIIQNIKNKGKNILIYQGGWAKRFSIQNVIKSLPLIESVNFLILGKPLEPNILDYYKKISKENNVSDRVYFIEQVSYFRLPNFTFYADVGIANFTYNKNETVNNLLLAGASNKIAEYCSCGLPILAPETTANKKFIVDKKRGLSCNPDNPKEIAQGISSLLSNKDEFKENNLADFDKILNYDFQFDKILKKLERFD